MTNAEPEDTAQPEPAAEPARSSRPAETRCELCGCRTITAGTAILHYEGGRTRIGC